MWFTPIQVGLDVATSLTILGTAIIFLVNLKRKSDEAREKRLNDAVRSAVVDRLLEASHSLSTQYIRTIVSPLGIPGNIVIRGERNAEEFLKSNPILFEKAVSQYEEVHQSMSQYIDDIYAYTYQLYPLLDSLDGGEGQISTFKSSLLDIVNLLNKLLGENLSLLRELKEIMIFCKAHPLDTLGEEQELVLRGLAAVLMLNPSHKYWVNKFLPDEKIECYWNDDSPDRFEVRADGISNFVAFIYEYPTRSQAQVLVAAYNQYQDGVTHCKRFLIVIASIIHALIAREGEDQSSNRLSDLINRYEGAGYFSLKKEFR